jgi:Ca2+-binding EF-hand superfamily protein
MIIIQYFFYLKNAKMVNKFDLQNGYEINEEQIAVFEETFQILDKDSNGYITLQEIKEVMNSLGI